MILWNTEQWLFADWLVFTRKS